MKKSHAIVIKLSVLIHLELTYRLRGNINDRKKLTNEIVT